MSLQVKDLTISYGSNVVLKNINFTIEDNTIIGLLRRTAQVRRRCLMRSFVLSRLIKVRLLWTEKYIKIRQETYAHFTNS